MSVVIRVEHLSKAYQLGQIGTGTISRDLERWWTTRVRGKDDPFLKVGEVNDRTRKGESDMVWALNDVSFDVQAGEVLGIIGRNGAGKSTLLKILSRTTSPTRGQIKIKGRIASLLEVGTGFHPELTGRENVFLNGAILGMNKREIRNKFDEIVDFSGVERYIDTPVKRYSSGMYVRLAFAVAAHLEPEILVVDEVLAVGDAEFQNKCLGKMKDVSRNQGRTVLFVSHNMVAIQNLCEKTILIDQGTIKSYSNSSIAIQNYLLQNRKFSNGLDLRSRTDRQGDGKLKFVGVQILDAESNEEVHGAASGNDIVIRLKLYKQESIRITKLLIAIGVNDAFDNRICHLSTDLTNQSFLNIPENFEHVDVLIKKLPLNAGNYSVALYVAIDDQVSDWVQNAYHFSIEEGDFYNTGRMISASAGTFLLDYKFHF